MGAALGEQLGYLIDPPLASRRLFGLLGPGDIGVLPAVGQPREERPRLGVGSQAGGQILGDGHLPGGGVNSHLDIEKVPSLHSRRGAYRRTHRDHGLAAHHGDGAPIAVPVDRDLHWDPLGATQTVDHLLVLPSSSSSAWNFIVSPLRLAARGYRREHDGRSEHPQPPSTR